MAYDPEQYWPDRAARQGRSYVGRGGRPEHWDRQRRAIVPHLWVLDGRRRVLDFGCGPERFRPALEALGLEYHGIDIIPNYGTMEAEDVLEAGYDAAVAIYVLQHITDPQEYQEAVDGIHWALEPEGVLFVVDKMPDPAVEWAEHMRPRGMAGILALQPWADHVVLGTHDGHWIGALTK